MGGSWLGAGLSSNCDGRIPRARYGRCDKRRDPKRPPTPAQRHGLQLQPRTPCRSRTSRDSAPRHRGTLNDLNAARLPQLHCLPRVAYTIQATSSVQNTTSRPGNCTLYVLHTLARNCPSPRPSKHRHHCAISSPARHIPIISPTRRTYLRSIEYILYTPRHAPYIPRTAVTYHRTTLIPHETTRTKDHKTQWPTARRASTPNTSRPSQDARYA